MSRHGYFLVCLVMTVLHESVELLQTLFSHQCFLFADSPSLYDYNYSLKRTQ